MEEGTSTYEKIMGIKSTGDDLEGGGAEALSNRLITFRQWASDEAKITVHPSICIVNGEATDGTKNAPVLAFGPPPGAQPLALTSGQGRVGMVDGEEDRALYERTIGCQVRTVKEIKQDEVMMTVPRAAMITPDVVAASDAGRAVLACCQALTNQGETGFWDVFENTTLCEQAQAKKAKSSNGTQLLVKILQERKRAESAYTKAIRNESSASAKKELAAPGLLSTRAPILAFLIHQRFAPCERPLVVNNANVDFDQVVEADGDSNALKNSKRINPLDDAPVTFAPYARTLPSSVSLPICWKRNELALLSGCITGIAPLQEIAATTLQLVTEFVALIDAGILYRFPSIFPPGVLTWERWVWAASVFTSRLLPATCYLNDGEQNAVVHDPGEERDLQSPREVWDELGVLVPILDMLNHEIDTHQVTWQPNCPENSTIIDDMQNESTQERHPPRAILHKRVKKGQQIYTCYGHLSNRILMLQYGFCQMTNSADETRLGWGLMDAVGNVSPPSDYTPLFDVDDDLKKFQVFESTEPVAVNDWWSDERLELLELEVAQNVDSSFMSSLKMGKKMTGAAHCDGSYDPILLTTALVGTMPIPELTHHMAKRRSAVDGRVPITISPRHQQILRSYLGFIFSQKLQKLLENLDNGLKGHFGGVRLWTKVSQNGIKYKKSDGEADENQLVGWQTFFDEHAYTATMEVEKRYYAIGPDSCVLTLYDGQLQALHATLEGLLTAERFEEGVIQQLRDLGFHIGNEDENIPDEIQIKQDPANGGSEDQASAPSSGNKVGEKIGDGKKKEEGKSPKKSRRNRKRNNSTATVGSDRAPAIKLHIGNLSYSTLADDLYDFFARDHGRDNILECHIPTERETGKSRGFGFVTLPEAIARQILTSQRKYELDGRILKIAESNSAGSNKPNKFSSIPPTSERCGTCGYRPKYCVCAMSSAGHPMSNGPPMDPEYGRDYDQYGASRQRGRERYSRSRSPYYRDRARRSSREDDYYRDYSRDSRDRRHYHDRSRSRSYSRGRDRDRRERRRDHKSRDRSRERSSRERSRERDRSRDRSPRDRSRDRSRERSRDRSRDRSRERSVDRSRDQRDRQSRRRSWEHRSRGSRHSRSRSPSHSRKDRTGTNGEVSNKGDGVDDRKGSSPDATKSGAHADDVRAPENRKRRSRSRSRGRSRKSRKKKRHARSQSRSTSPVGTPV